MGNHEAGRAMGKAAIELTAARGKRTALELLDIICDPYRGCDAEFESEDPNNPGSTHPDYHVYTAPTGPLGQLIVEAFDDSGTDWAAEEQAIIDSTVSFDGWEVWDVYWEKWDDGPYAKFRNRYDFC